MTISRFIQPIRLVVVLLLFISVDVYSQNSVIRGFVYDKKNGEALLYTPVLLKGTPYSTVTDENGFYTFTKLGAGSYELLIQVMGYDSATYRVSVKENEIVNQQIYLNPTTINLKEIDISADKQVQRSEVRISVTKITPKEIRSVPAIGGEPDVAQYLQVLPGVIFSGDQGGQLYIRGGTPVMNKVLLDGMVIYNPFHSIGLFSVFDTDIIRSAEVYTGGMPADYGGRISSVMDFSTREGNRKRWAGKVSAGTINSKVLIEGPIKAQKEEGGGSSSVLLSVKHSYLDKTSETIYDYVREDGLPYSFTDIYGKISFNNENGSRLNLFGFNFRDQADFEDIARTDWKSGGFGANFLVVPAGSNLLIDGVLAFSRYNIEQQEADDRPRRSSINGFNLDLNVSNFFGKNELRYGFSVLGFRTEYEAYSITGIQNEQIENTTEFAGFSRYRIAKEKWVIDPGIRIQFYSSLSEISLEPRLGIKYNLNDKIRLKTAGGMYSQNLMSTISDRDVVNLFYGFISSPASLPEEFKGNTVKSRLQKSADIVAGIEWDIIPHLELNLEVYYKQFTQLTNINRDKVYPDNGNYDDQPDYLVKTFIIEEGNSRGIDLVLKYERKRYYFWGVYSLGSVIRDDGLKEYRPHFDRRHNVNLVGAYTFGKKYNWEFNIRWNYGSGFPFTQTGGFYEYLNFSDGLNTDIVSENGDLGILYGEINEGQLPDYHRLDFSLKRIFNLSAQSVLEATVSAINVYDYENIFYFDRVRYTRLNQLPFLPSFNLSLSF